MSWRVETGDCLSALRKMDSSSVDCCISDPPYNEKTHAMVATNKKGTDGTIQLGFEALSSMAHVREMLRVAKRWVICFCALEQFGEYQLYAGDSWVRAGVWVRTNSMPQKQGDRPGQGAEGVAIMWAGSGRMNWGGGGLPAVWRGPRSSGGHHPTEKPEWLMEILIRQFTEYGETVLDTHCGSGTTGVAAVRLGRNFIGYEMIAKHAETAIVRLTATHEQKELSFVKKRKPKQPKLFKETKDAESKAKNGKGKTKVGEAAAGLADHFPRPEGDEEQTSGVVEEVREVDGGDHGLADRWGAVDPEGEDLRPEEDQAEDEGPETLGDPFEEVDPNEEPDGETERGW